MSVSHSVPCARDQNSKVQRRCQSWSGCGDRIAAGLDVTCCGNPLSLFLSHRAPWTSIVGRKSLRDAVRDDSRRRERGERLLLANAFCCRITCSSAAEHDARSRLDQQWTSRIKRPDTHCAEARDLSGVQGLYPWVSVGQEQQEEEEEEGECVILNTRFHVTPAQCVCIVSLADAGARMTGRRASCWPHSRAKAFTSSPLRSD